MNSKTGQYREHVERPHPEGNDPRRQIDDLTERLEESQAARTRLQEELRRFEKERMWLNRWSSKIPFVLILLCFVAVGVASYFYPKSAGVDWLWYGKPAEVTNRLMQPPQGETPKIVLTIAIWVSYAVLWQIFVLVNITDMMKYLHIYFSRKFRLLAQLTVILLLVGGVFLGLLCLRAGHLVETVMSEKYPIKWLLTVIVIVPPLIGALLLAGSFPAPVED